MRVRIEYTVEISDEIRREINRHYGKDGLATREDIKQWYEDFGDSMNGDLSMWADDYANAESDS